MKPQYVVISEILQEVLLLEYGLSTLWQKNCNSLIHNNNLNDEIPVDTLG